MPRSVSLSYRKAIESPFNDEANLAFLTITHPTLSVPIRVNWDTKDYVYNGNTFIGFPFELSILTDDESPPTARLAIQNIDPRISDALRGLGSPLRIKIELLHTDDFDLSVTPRVAIVGSPPPNVAYSADKLFLINIKSDILTLSADITGWNYLQRVWPGVRATQERFPGLFR